MYNVIITSFEMTEEKHFTWIGERPRSIHIAYVCCYADCQDAMHQGDQTTVPLIAPGAVHMTQYKVERDPAAQAEKGTSHEQRHLLF